MKKRYKKVTNNTTKSHKNLFWSSLFVILPVVLKCFGFFSLKDLPRSPRVFINYKLCWCCKLSVQHLLLRPKNTNNYKTGVFSVKWPLTFKLNTLSSEVLIPPESEQMSNDARFSKLAALNVKNFVVPGLLWWKKRGIFLHWVSQVFKIKA